MNEKLKAFASQAMGALRQWARINPLKVRTAIGAVLVLGSQVVPSLAGVAGNEILVDVITGVVLGAVGADAVRTTKLKK